MDRPAMQPKAVANWGRLVTMPLMRAKPGKCGFVAALRRFLASPSFSHANCPKSEEETLMGSEPFLRASGLVGAVAPEKTKS